MSLASGPNGAWSETACDAQGRALLAPLPAWRGLPVQMLVIPAQSARGRRHFTEPTLQLALSGHGRRHYRYGRQSRSLQTRPHMVELYGRDFEIDAGSWQGDAGQCIAISFPPAYAAGTDSGQPLDLATCHEVFDPQLAQLVRLLASEAQQRGPHGPLYAEGLSLALIGYLQAHHGSHARAAQAATRGFSPAQTQLLRALIHDQPGEDLSVQRMAALLGMSVHQFSRRFIASFGSAPHRYVMQQRIDAARRMLRQQPEMPIVEIALAHGFATQSHFTQALRRSTGLTPAVARFY